MMPGGNDFCIIRTTFPSEGTRLPRSGRSPPNGSELLWNQAH